MVEDEIIKRMVGNIVEKNQEFLIQKDDTNKFDKMVPQLLRKGVDNLNLSMFSPEMKFNLLTALGEAYRRKGNLNDAVKSFILAGNRKKLDEIGEDYERLLQFENCIEVYKMSGNVEKLNEIGKRCLNEGRLAHAKRHL